LDFEDGRILRESKLSMERKIEGVEIEAESFWTRENLGLKSWNPMI